MPTLTKQLTAAVLATGLAAIGSAASAASPASDAHSCFTISQWQGWKAPSADVLYLGVNMHDVYKVELSAGSPQLQWPDVHLISIVRGSDMICNAIDLQLAVADTNGFREPLIAKSITKLTPAEIAAIPPKYRPN